MDTITAAGLFVLAWAMWFAMGQAGLRKHRMVGLLVLVAVFAAGRMARHG